MPDRDQLVGADAAANKRGRPSMAQVIEAVNAILSPAYLVGGAVRDAARGCRCRDYDFVTTRDVDAIEDGIRHAGHHPNLSGRRFGTIGFKLDGVFVQVTTLTSPSATMDGTASTADGLTMLREDLSRRDFTVNAMAIADGEIVDPFDGMGDLSARLLRAVGKSRDRFDDDPVRMVRAARFVSTLNLSVEGSITAAMERDAHKVLRASGERISNELDKTLAGAHVEGALQLLAETGVLKYILPEVALQVGFDQNSAYHDRTLFEHTIATVVGVSADDLHLRWAALLHDIGKPYVRRDKPDRSTYVHHDLLGARLVSDISGRLKWPKDRRETVTQLVLHHLKDDSPLRDADNAAKTPRIANMQKPSGERPPKVGGAR